MAEIQMVSMWTKIASNLKSMKNNNLPNLLFEKYILCLVNIYDKTRQCIKKQRHHFADKGLHSQTYGFSNHHIWMWELNHKEGRVPKNWYFWTVVMEKTLESPKDNKETTTTIKPVNPRGNEPWIFIGRTGAEAEAPIFWPPGMKNWLTGKDPDAGKDWRQDKGVTEDGIIGWHHGLNRHKSEQTLGDSEGQGSLPCCSSLGRKESDMTAA